MSCQIWTVTWNLMKRLSFWDSRNIKNWWRFQGNSFREFFIRAFPVNNPACSITWLDSPFFKGWFTSSATANRSESLPITFCLLCMHLLTKKCQLCLSLSSHWTLTRWSQGLSCHDSTVCQKSIYSQSCTPFLVTIKFCHQFSCLRQFRFCLGWCSAMSGMA